jgi:adenylosuccinate lyase
MIAFTSLLEGLNKIEINEEVMRKELEDNYCVISEGIQTRMKVLGIEGSYEKMKEITRKNSDSKKELLKFIEQSEFTPEEKKYLKTITPFNYTGIYKL